MKGRVPRMRVGRRRFWVPRTVAQLRTALREMGVVRVNGVPLGRVRRDQLLAVFLAMRGQAELDAARKGG